MPPDILMKSTAVILIAISRTGLAGEIETIPRQIRDRDWPVIR